MSDSCHNNSNFLLFLYRFLFFSNLTRKSKSFPIFLNYLSFLKNFAFSNSFLKGFECLQILIQLYQMYSHFHGFAQLKNCVPPRKSNLQAIEATPTIIAKCKIFNSIISFVTQNRLIFDLFNLIKATMHSLESSLKRTANYNSCNC